MLPVVMIQETMVINSEHSPNQYRGFFIHKVKSLEVLKIVIGCSKIFV